MFFVGSMCHPWLGVVHGPWLGVFTMVIMGWPAPGSHAENICFHYSLTMIETSRHTPLNTFKINPNLSEPDKTHFEVKLFI